MAALRKIGILLLIIHSASGPLRSFTTASDKAFATFKSLQGKWHIESHGKPLPIEMAYDVASNGSVVTERFGKELSVIYRNGEGLLMTHFCNRGTAPRLRLKATTQSGLLEFEMFDITNLPDSHDAHVRRISYRFLDSNTIALEIVWQTGNVQEPEKYTLSRF